jgi:hypothetical protein
LVSFLYLNIGSEMKHKKALSVILITFITLVIVLMVFLEDIAQRTANYYLNPVNESFRAQVSSMNIDYSKAQATFSVSAHNRETQERVLDVKEIKADYDFGDGLKLAVDTVNLYVSNNTIDALKDMSENQSQESEKEKKKEPPSLDFMAEFKLNDFYIRMVDADLEGEIKKILVNFNKGSGFIDGISAIHQEDLQFLEVEKIELAFKDDLKDHQISVIDPNIKISQALLNTFQETIPHPKQAQTEDTEKTEDEANSAPAALSLLSQFGVKDFDIELIGGETLHGAFENLLVNLKDGSGKIENISANIAGTKTRLMDIESIKMGYDSQAITQGENAKLTVDVNKPELTISKQTMEAFKKLPKPPEGQKPETTSSPPPLKQLSRISVNNTEVNLREQGIRTQIKEISAKMNEGRAEVNHINSTLLQNGQKVLSVVKITAQFDPENLTGPDKPDLKIAVIEPHLRVSKKLLGNLKSEENKEKKKSMNPLPVVISRILVGDAKVSFIDYPGIGNQKHFAIEDIFGSIRNITLAPNTPLGSFAFNAGFGGESKIITDGKLDLADTPLEWSANWKLFNFDMEKLNPELRARIPLTFNEGVLDFYGEAIQRDDRIVGYVKPVLEEADYFGNQREFKGPRHFLAEVFATVTNWLFERGESNTVATRVPFVIEDGKMDTKVGEAVWNAVEHGLIETDKVKKGVEDRYQLKQAQEEKEEN